MFSVKNIQVGEQLGRIRYIWNQLGNDGYWSSLKRQESIHLVCHYQKIGCCSFWDETRLRVQPGWVDKESHTGRVTEVLLHRKDQSVVMAESIARGQQSDCANSLGKGEELLKGLQEHCLVVFAFSWWLNHCEEVIEAENKISGQKRHTDPWVSVLNVVSNLWWWMGL